MLEEDNQQQSYIDPTCLDIPGMGQVTALETLGTFVDYLNPVVNQEFLGSVNLNRILARTILADIISIKNEVSNFSSCLNVKV